MPGIVPAPLEQRKTVSAIQSIHIPISVYMQGESCIFSLQQAGFWDSLDS